MTPTTDYGSISGTLTGQRTDGTAFSEPFNFNLSLEKGTFETKDSGDQFLKMNLYGSPVSNSISFSLKYDKKKVVSLDESSHIYFDFLKELKENTAFTVHVETVEDTMNISWPIKPALNDATYHFAFDPSRYAGGHDIDYDGNWLYKTTDGSSVAFDSYYGDFQYIKRPNGATEYSSSIYGSLTLKVFGSYPYFTDSHGTNLSMKESIAPDRLTITNFSFDEESGSMKFDFVLLLSDRGRSLSENSTQHLLTITGKANILVYANVLSRTRG
jgi:hypothetical protein